MAKTCENQPLLSSQPIALGKCSPCAIPLCSPLFVTSLHDEGSQPSTAPKIHFSPKPYHHTSSFPWCIIFTPSSCEAYSISNQVNFLGIHNDLIFIELCSKGWSKPRVLLVCYSSYYLSYPPLKKSYHFIFFTLLRWWNNFMEFQMYI